MENMFIAASLVGLSFWAAVLIGRFIALGDVEREDD